MYQWGESVLFVRSDGVAVKDASAYDKILALIMKDRNDALVYFKSQLELKNIKQFRKDARARGKNYPLLVILYTAIIRSYYLRPRLNRFVVSGRIYQRQDITIAMVVKPRMSDDSEETVIKLHFKGNESLDDVERILQDGIDNARQQEAVETKTDKLVAKLNKLPTFCLKLAVGLFKSLDKINCLPTSLVEASPFHATVFVTNVGSIGLDAIYHHIYNFGTIGNFIAIGKKVKVPKLVDGNIEESSCINVGIVSDERICDGLYLSKSMRVFKKFIEHPELLETRADSIQ